MYVDETVRQALRVISLVLIVALLALLGCDVLALLRHKRLRKSKTRGEIQGKANTVVEFSTEVKLNDRWRARGMPYDSRKLRHENIGIPYPHKCGKHP